MREKKRGNFDHLSMHGSIQQGDMSAALFGLHESPCTISVVFGQGTHKFLCSQKDEICHHDQHRPAQHFSQTEKDDDSRWL